MKLVLVGSLVVVVGCGGGISPEERRAAAAIKLIEGAPPPEFEIIKEVEGLSCAVQSGSSPDMNAAREEMKVEAARVGGNAIASVVCQEGGVLWSSNCWKHIRCVGDAGRI